MDFDLVKLKHLLVIAQTGNFSRAADQLCITQPALSRSVAAMEQRFGFKIFERGRSGATPTAVGAMVLADAEALLRHARILDQNLRLYAAGEAGKIAFGMGPLIASITLRGLATRMMAQSPRLQMWCSIKSPDVLLAELMSGQIEIAFCSAEHIPHEPEAAIQHIGSIAMAPIVRAAHPLAKVKNLTIEKIRAFPTAHAASAPAVEYTAKESLDGGALHCDNYEVVRQIILDTDAVWFSSPQIVAEDLAAGRMIPLSISDMPLAALKVSVMRLKGQKISPAAEAILAYTSKLLKAARI